MKCLRKNSLPGRSLGGVALLALMGVAGGAASWAQPQTPAPAAQGNRDHLKVPVELEWEEVPGAKIYELEFQNLDGKSLATFRSSSSIFKFKFKVGKYRVRSRVADARRVFGVWSDLQEFTVKPKEITVPENSIATKGVIDPKTLTAEVALHWGPAPGAGQFLVKVMNEKDEVVKEELVEGLSCKMNLEAGNYHVSVTAVGPQGIQSDPVNLPGKVVIDTVQLAKPLIALEEVADPKNPKTKLQRLPQTRGLPTVRWKNASLIADTVGTLEYAYFFGEEWLPVAEFVSKNAKEVILEKATKPGRYRISAWAEASGLKKSEVTTYEFVVKPTEY